MTEEQLLIELRSGNSHVLREVYVHLNSVTSYVTKNSGTVEDGHDVFQEAVIVFYRNALKEDFKLTSTIGTYLYAVGKRVWLNKLRKKSKMRLVSSTENDDTSAVEAFEYELPEFASPDLGKRINDLLADLGEKCTEILQMFYFKKMNLDAIKEKLSYNSSQVVRQQKYRCLKKIREKVSGTPNLIN